MSLCVVYRATMYQCSRCLPPSIGSYWLLTTTRAYTCMVHGPALFYEFSSEIVYDESDLPQQEIEDFTHPFSGNSPY